jgi:hypothetical protein
MPLTNAEYQARWREKHLKPRRLADRVANLLVRRKWPEGHLRELAAALRPFLSREANRALRRELKRLVDPSKQDEQCRRQFAEEDEKRWCELWLREHPGRTIEDYKRLTDEGVWNWRRATGEAAVAAEWRDWERDHPGQEWQKFQCGMTPREHMDYQRWARQRERAAVRKSARAL